MFSIKDDNLFEEQHYLLQKELKEEESKELDEKFMFEEDRKLEEGVEMLLKRLQKLYRAESERKKLQNSIKCSLM